MEEETKKELNRVLRLEKNRNILFLVVYFLLYLDFYAYLELELIL